MGNRLPLKDGSVYLFDKHKGLLSMTDPYGHAIAYSEDGISHSSGASLSFERDTSERIERIVDELGRTIEYQYGEDGMLEQVIQKGGGSYATKVLENYAYSMGVKEMPILKDIIAPDGTRLGTFEYDSQGRKIGLIDHEGNRVLFGYDAPEHHYTVTDRRGNPTEYTYDSDGNVTSITDAEGNSESYSYDENGYLLAKTNKLGYTNAFTYDEDGNMLTETDALGNSVSFSYDDDGNKLTATDPLGNTTHFTYDGHGNVLTQKDALGHVTHFAYDADGNMTSSTDALGNSTQYGYDEQGNVLNITDPFGQSKRYSYDFYGNVLTSTDKAGHATAYEYDPQGSLVKTIDASGNVHTHQRNTFQKIEHYVDPSGNEIWNAFDLEGNLTRSQDQSGHETHFAYDPNGNQTRLTTSVETETGQETFSIERVYDRLNRPTEEIDGDGRAITSEYDALGRQVAVIDKQGNRTEVAYDPRGLIRAYVSPDGRTASYTYDAAGRVTTQIDSTGRQTHHEYDELGRMTKIVSDTMQATREYDALGRLTAMNSGGQHIGMEYDALGRMISQTDILGRVTSYEYAPNGALQKIHDPRGNSFELEYDAGGSLTKLSFPDNTSMSYTYDRSGYSTSETDQNGHTTYFEWDEAGKLTKAIDPSGYETTYSYNDIGYLVAHTDANGHVTRYEYDTLGRMTRKTYPLGMSQTFTYHDDNTFSMTDFNGVTTTYTLDSSGRVSHIEFPDGEFLSYTYTDSGNIEHVVDARGTTSFDYDEDGRLLRRAGPDGAFIAYTYDAHGNRTSVSVPSGITHFEYNSIGQLIAAIDPDGATTQYTYDEDDNLTTVRYPNDTSTNYGYDNLDRIIFVENRKANGELISSYSYTLGQKGERVRVEEHTGRIIEYTYDAADRVIEERIHDPVGNLSTKTENGVTTTYIYDENDRLLSGEGYTYTYDNNGNMLSKTGHGQQYRFSYNALDQLRRATISTLQVSSTIEYLYDHDGIRVGKIIDGVDETRYLVDKNLPYAQVIEEERRHGALSATVNYVYGHGLISQNIDGIKQYYHYDGLHNTRALSGVSGKVTDTYHYDAYGALTEQTGTTENSYLYRGEQFDRESGNYYLRARYYSPETGRFSTTDPLEGDVADQRTFHRYRYGNGDPVNNLDPTGAWSVTESLVTANIVSMLSSYGGWMLADKYQQQFAKISEWFPDAGVVGGSIDVFGARNLQLLRKLPWFRKVVAPILKWTDPTAVTSRNILWRYPMQPMFALGAEGVFSFGSREIGAAICFSPQVRGGYASKYDIPQKKPSGRSWNLYTGYIWNLWNFRDYLGGSGVINLGIGSYFFGMKFNEELTQFTAFHYGGLHWNILPVSPGGLSWGGGFGYTYRVLAARVGDVPAESLACWWTSLQGAIALVSTLKHNNLSAVATMVGTGFTGMIVKSKQVYNKQHGLEEQGRTEYGEKGTRPADWHSGFQLDLSRMYLLGL